MAAALSILVMPPSAARLHASPIAPVVLQDNEQAGPSSEGIDSGPGSVPENEGDANRSSKPPSLSFFSLMLRGGWFMIPLLILSIAVAAISIERLVALRKENIMPQQMVSHLGNLSRNAGGFDPRSAYRICQQVPSSASKVIRAMLLKVGRPIPEIEAAIQENSQREADRQLAPVSWLTLIATVAPLVGLLGTVWGITQAFYDMTNLGPNENKADALATGIYTALVTTLVGLMIAIPSAVIAHFFENRIVKMFNRINEMAGSLVPQVEKYEGRLRFSDTADEPTSGESRKQKASGSSSPEIPSST